MTTSRSTRVLNTMLVFVLLVATMSCGCLLRQVLTAFTPVEARDTLMVCCSNCRPLVAPQDDSGSSDEDSEPGEQSSSSCCIKGTGLDLTAHVVAVFVPIAEPPLEFLAGDRCTRQLVGPPVAHGPPRVQDSGRSLIDHGSILRL